MRNTKYSIALQKYLTSVGHASNAEILEYLQNQFPELSATTIHRCTARMANSGVIAEAPYDTHGNKRYDANNTPHDHFECDTCGLLRDVTIPQSVKKSIQQSLGQCRLDRSLTITGICKYCNSKNKESL